MTTDDSVYLLSCARTPIGSMLGVFSPVAAPQLGAVAIRAAVERAGLEAADVDEVLMGNVLMAGQGQAPARQAALGAGLPRSVPCTTVNKMCGSGLKTLMLAVDAIRAGSAERVVAGGMESMTNAPYLIPRARGGYRYGHAELLDHMALDGLEDAYEKRTPMGVYAERTATKYGFSRAEQDAFAVESLTRTQRATADGRFDWEIVPVEVAGKSGAQSVRRDETPSRAKAEKIPNLKPAFARDGTVTAASSASISDGAAAVVAVSAAAARRLDAKPLARVLGHATHARSPDEFTLAPIHAIGRLLQRLDWQAGDVDCWEINEAFAVVAMAAIREHRLDPARVNIHGGACALGHPIGASGARLVATLLGALRASGGKRGIASLCIGGGEAVALAIEML
ncbi:MAG: acetyl-CoA C-acyltransferase [Gammaproteobacteria bacterium]|nr:acetyl-CoA C-acyltransferase [Gammaproteobacteria bacterium]